MQEQIPETAAAELVRHPGGGAARRNQQHEGMGTRNSHLQRSWFDTLEGQKGAFPKR